MNTRQMEILEGIALNAAGDTAHVAGLRPNVHPDGQVMQFAAARLVIEAQPQDVCPECGARRDTISLSTLRSMAACNDCEGDITLCIPGSFGAAVYVRLCALYGHERTSDRWYSEVSRLRRSRTTA